jgi:hypothetical protein
MRDVCENNVQTVSHTFSQFKSYGGETFVCEICIHWKICGMYAECMRNVCEMEIHWKVLEIIGNTIDRLRKKHVCENVVCGMYVRIMCKQCHIHSHSLDHTAANPLYAGLYAELYAECMRNVCEMEIHWKLLESFGKTIDRRADFTPLH